MSRITHEQARQHLENKIKDGNILTVLEYIKQQEKREKLLDLSLNLNDVWKNRYQYNNSIGLIDDLERQIQELRK